MNEPAIEDWFYGFKKYKEKIKSIPLAFKYTNFKPAEINAIDNTNDNKSGDIIKNIEDYSDEEKIQYILEFLISKTLKDCSILIAVQSIEDNNNTDGTVSINTPILMTQSSDSSLTTRKTFMNSHLENLNKKLSKSSNTVQTHENNEINSYNGMSSIEAKLTTTKVSLLKEESYDTTTSTTTPSSKEKSNSNLIFDKDKENYREVMINGRKYRYNIHVVDLDSKSIKKIPNYFKLDQDIVNCYTEYKKSFGNCRESKCID